MEDLTKKETRKEVGRWLMDIAKYILTAAIITSFLGEFSQRWVYYGAGLLAVCTCFFGGLYLFNKK